MLIIDDLYPVIAFLAIIAVTWLLTHFLDTLLKRLIKSRALVTLQARRLIEIMIWFFGILFALEQVGLGIEVLLLVIGLVGVAAIVASRDTLQNLFSKYFSDIYLPFSIGDSIRVGEHSGRIIEMNPMSTIILTEQEEIVCIPNSMFSREIVVNTTPQAWKEVNVPMAIDNEIPLPDFESEVIKSCNKLRQHLDQRFPPIMTVKRREAKTSEITLTLMIKEPGMKEAITSEISSRVAEIIERMQKRKKS
jgi:small conductance mechanosensitive channel